MIHSSKQKGFTLVELLIVIVVIAILAAITIVAYSGIQKRAQASTAQSDLESLNKQILLYQVDNGTFPSDLSVLNNGSGPKTASTSFSYTVSTTTTSNDSFCVTGTNGTTSYYVMQNAAPVAGACPGDGIGGIPPITNLITNPNAATLTGYNGYGATASNTLMTGGGYNGSPTYIRRNFTATGTGGIYYNPSPAQPATAGKTYTLSGYVKTSRAISIAPTIEWYGTSGLITRSPGSPFTATTTFTRGSVSGTAPAGTTYTVLTFYTSSSWNAGDYEDIDAVMLTEGSTPYTYADGDSSGWRWTNGANASPSQGPAL